jgi:N-acetylneuraminic acid mutarotase
MKRLCPSDLAAFCVLLSFLLVNTGCGSAGPDGHDRDIAMDIHDDVRVADVIEGADTAGDGAGHWAPTATSGAPTARTGHTAVWTGTEVIVWGGTPATQAGGRYNPATDSWQPMNVEGAPAPRTGHTAVWTGQEMIVWGGTAGATGARYDPATDTWKAISTAGAPTSSDGHIAVAADGNMIVWGGTGQSPIGAIYLAATDTWTPMADFGPRVAATAVWTGSRMVLWGGGIDNDCVPGEGSCIYNPQPYFDTGASYDPKTDTWTAISTTLAPTARARAVSCWTGDRMFVWGGRSASPTGPAFTLTTGGAYLPAKDVWVPMALAGAPTNVTNPQIAWIGSRLVVWSADHFGCAAYYDPKTDGWSAMPTAGAPASREGAVGVWTGTEFVVWGGEGTVTGGRFTP